MLLAMAAISFAAKVKSIGSYLRVAIATLVVGLCIVSDEQTWVLLYPVVISLSMLSWFTFSYLNPPNAIEKLATLMEGRELPQQARDYTRKVCLVWMSFFFLNALVSLSTVVLFTDYWLIYNGLISYGLSGCLFAGEYLVRQRVKQKE